MFKLTILTVTLLTLQGSESSRILCVFSYPSAGHQAVFRTLTKELLQRGHEMVVVTTDPAYSKNDTPPNLTEIDVHDISYNMWRAEMAAYLHNIDDHPQKVHLPHMVEALHNLFMLQFNSDELQNIIKTNDRFDLILLEESVPSSYILSHLIKAPVILISSLGQLFNYNVMGTPRQEFLYPSVLRQRIMNMTFLEQIKDIYNVVSFEKAVGDVEVIQNEAFKSIIGHEITINELYNNVDLMMLNQFPLWTGIRPMPQSVVQLGGLHLKSEEPLPQDLQEFFNTSTNDVIFVSFGSLIHSSMLRPDKLQVLVNALSQLPYDVLWICDREIAGKGKNIRTFKWLPQADLLRHPKVKLFITHGGLQSTDEAIAAGVPVIGVPFISDQFFNSENYVRHKIGLKVDINTVTEEEMKAAVTKVITDKGYRDNVFNLRTLMKDQRQSSLSRAIWWTEYVLRHGGAKHLRSPSANMHWTQYLELELIIIALVFLLLLLLILAVLCYCLYKAMYRWYRRYNYRRLMDGMHYAR